MKTFFRVMWTYNAVCICILLVLLAMRPTQNAAGKDGGAQPEVAANAAYCPIAYYGQIEGAHWYLCQPRTNCMTSPAYVPDDRMHTLSECSVCSDPIYYVKGAIQPIMAKLRAE